jgi:hypothetical protein
MATGLAEGTEGALAKAALWRGETLMGRMLGDLMAGLDALAAERGSMRAGSERWACRWGRPMPIGWRRWTTGSTAVAHLCAFADMGPLIASGAHDLHGIYMSVPGLLAEGDMGDVAALIAPRPQFIAYGGRDPLTPGGRA